MRTKSIPVEQIPPASSGKPAVWAFVPESATRDETWVRRIKKIPVTSLSGRLVALEVTLANGTQVPALMSNIDLGEKRLNEHFLSVSIFHNRKWIPLARYHDVDAKTHGPAALAKALGLPPKQVFPLKFDLTGIARGKKECLVGAIDISPRKKLRRAQLMRLVVESL